MIGGVTDDAPRIGGGPRRGRRVGAERGHQGEDALDGRALRIEHALGDHEAAGTACQARQLGDVAGIGRAGSAGVVNNRERVGAKLAGAAGVVGAGAGVARPCLSPGSFGVGLKRPVLVGCDEAGVGAQTLGRNVGEKVAAGTESQEWGDRECHGLSASQCSEGKNDSRPDAEREFEICRRRLFLR